MDLYVLIAFAAGAILVLAMLYGIYAGIRKMQGHPTRLDRFYGTVARTQAAGVFPPALRGETDPQVQEVREVSRGDDAARSTPGDSLDKA
jgi:hypothetical protein